MPHIIVEYSSNIEDRVDVRELVRATHDAALGTGVFKATGLRTRAERRDVYCVADCNPSNAFVAVTVRAKGRDDQTRKKAGQGIFDAVCLQLENVIKTQPIGITVEMQELDDTAAFRMNTL